MHARTSMLRELTGVLLLQVLSQFSTVSSSAGGGSFPEPAATFVGVLGLTNLDVPGFVPFGCVTSETTFYHRVVFAAALPIVGIGLLCCFPLSQWLRGRASSAAIGTVKGFSMLLLVVTLPSTATALVQVSENDDDQSLPRAQLTISCMPPIARRSLSVIHSMMGHF